MELRTKETSCWIHRPQPISSSFYKIWENEFLEWYHSSLWNGQISESAYLTCLERAAQNTWLKQLITGSRIRGPFPDVFTLMNLNLAFVAYSSFVQTIYFLKTKTCMYLKAEHIAKSVREKKNFVRKLKVVAVADFRTKELHLIKLQNTQLLKRWTEIFL